eukprot:scaffold772_cov339-Pavlova_lutheri.AAC.20
MNHAKVPFIGIHLDPYANLLRQWSPSKVCRRTDSDFRVRRAIGSDGDGKHPNETTSQARPRFDHALKSMDREQVGFVPW